MSGKAHMAEGIPGKDGPLYRQALGLPLNAACNLEQAITRTAEQSHLVALAERDALTAQVAALTAQRDEAVRLLRVFGDAPCWVSESHKACFNHDEPAETCSHRLAREFVAGVDQ